MSEIDPKLIEERRRSMAAMRRKAALSGAPAPPPGHDVPNQTSPPQARDPRPSQRLEVEKPAQPTRVPDEDERLVSEQTVQVLKRLGGVAAAAGELGMRAGKQAGELAVNQAGKARGVLKEKLRERAQRVPDPGVEPRGPVGNRRRGFAIGAGIALFLGSAAGGVWWWNQPKTETPPVTVHGPVVPDTTAPVVARPVEEVSPIQVGDEGVLEDPCAYGGLRNAARNSIENCNQPRDVAEPSLPVPLDEPETLSSDPIEEQSVVVAEPLKPEPMSAVPKPVRTVEVATKPRPKPRAIQVKPVANTSPVPAKKVNGNWQDEAVKDIDQWAKKMEIE